MVVLWWFNYNLCSKTASSEDAAFLLKVNNKNKNMSLNKFKRSSLGDKHRITNEEILEETEKLKTDTKKVVNKTKKKDE